MFERYTESARRLLFFARYESSQFGSPEIDTPHMLLGLVRVNKGITARFFEASHVSLERMREDIERLKTSAEPLPTSTEIPFSAATRRVLRYAEEEADRLRHSYIGSEHLLLALVREEDSIAGAILARHGVRLDAAREQIVTLLASTPVVQEPDRTDLVAQIDRIRRLIAQLQQSMPNIEGSNEVLQLIWMELDTLRGRVGG